MHILLIHQAFVTTGEAGGTRHFELARRLVKKGYRVTIIASPISYLTGEAKRGKMETETVDGIQIVYARTSPGLHRGFVRRLGAFFSFMFSAFQLALGIRDIDVVWGTSPNLFQAFAAWAAARCKRARFLLEIRDLWPDFAIGMGVLTNPLMIHAARRLEKFLYRHADRIIVNSPGFIPHIRKISGKTASLVANSADAEMFAAADGGARYRNEPWRAGSAFVAMYTGAHGPANDLDTALEAAALVLDKNPRIRFVFVGSGKDKPRLMDAAAERNLTNVFFLPPVSKAEICELIAAADVGLAILKAIPEFTTTYPNKVFDFMAAGKAVVCQIDGVIRTLVERYEAGVFVPPGNAAALAETLIELEGKRALCAAMGRNGRAAVRADFSREKTAETFAAELEALKAGAAG